MLYRTTDKIETRKCFILDCYVYILITLFLSSRSHVRCSKTRARAYTPLTDNDLSSELEVLEVHWDTARSSGLWSHCLRVFGYEFTRFRRCHVTIIVRAVMEAIRQLETFSVVISVVEFKLSSDECVSQFREAGFSSG